MNIKLTYDQLAEAFEAKDFKFFDKGAYNVNLYGIRNSSYNANEWNDVLGIAYRDHIGNPINMMHRGSTKPGLYWLKDKMGNIEGTAILCPGQHSNCWKIGLHKGYEALQQKAEGVFKVWRDDDKDGRFDYHGDVYTNVTGLNCHTESLLLDSDKVGAYSAGCQVRAISFEHFQMMEIVKRSNQLFGNSFSYTLFDERELMDLAASRR